MKQLENTCIGGAQWRGESVDNRNHLPKPGFFHLFSPPKRYQEERGGGDVFHQNNQRFKSFPSFSSVQEHGERGRDGTVRYKGQGGKIGMTEGDAYTIFIVRYTLNVMCLVYLYIFNSVDLFLKCEKI